MHEKWLHAYIVEHKEGLGLSDLRGPYKTGPDFKARYRGKFVKVEAEWSYENYFQHKHPTTWADVLIVASQEPPTEKYIPRLPKYIINLSRDSVYSWATPKCYQEEKLILQSYPWRRLSRSLLDLYCYYRKSVLSDDSPVFPGVRLALQMNKAQKPAGFYFDLHGLEEAYYGSFEDRLLWDYWLDVAYAVADHFQLKPAMFRPTWIDNLFYELVYMPEYKSDDSDIDSFKPVFEYIEKLPGFLD